MSKKDRTEIVPNEARGQNCREEEQAEPAYEVGQWFWLTTDSWRGKKVRWMGCIVEVGSNYVELEGARDEHDSSPSARVHLDEAPKRLEREENPDGIIGERVAFHQDRMNKLIEEAKQLTGSLSIPSLEGNRTAREEATALATIDPQVSYDKYKKDLVKAKDKTLPEIFKKVEAEAKMAKSWMSANIIPMMANANRMHKSIRQIEDRIFNIELYAGLTEQVVQIRDGHPAAMQESLHVMQRRHYMDEECLVAYEAGGMSFKDVKAFDKWMAKDQNLGRLMPHPRCVLSVKVRRFKREYESEEQSLSDFVSLWWESEKEEETFLYLKNGEQLFRMSSKYDFGDKLFPDMEAAKPTDKAWIQKSGFSVRRIVGDHEYQDLLERRGRWEKEVEEKKKTTPESDWWRMDRWTEENPDDFVPFDETSVLYDDALEMRAREMIAHNRIGLIIQGLLDRSPVFHPHPPWRIWDEAGFQLALKLVYDQSRALVAGEKPDFEAYRARLNASITEGTATVGQREAWLRHEAKKENRRRASDYRLSSMERSRSLVRYAPWDNKGPGIVDRVESFVKKSGKCVYKWEKERRFRPSRYHQDETPVKIAFTATTKDLLNADAYQPGDFKQFFNDPRTREEYVKWAPYLLAAEDYKAGKRKVGETK